MDAKRYSSMLKFDSNLELDISDTNQLDKEQFISTVVDEVKYYGIVFLDQASWWYNNSPPQKNP